MRTAVEEFVSRRSSVAGMRANSGGNLRVAPDLSLLDSENVNPVVEVIADPPDMVAIGL